MHILKADYILKTTGTTSKFRNIIASAVFCNLGITMALNGPPDRSRTCDLCLRRASLYPAELRVENKKWHSIKSLERMPALNSFCSLY